VITVPLQPGFSIVINGLSLIIFVATGCLRQRQCPWGCTSQAKRVLCALTSFALQRIDSEYPASQRGDLLIFVAGLADITALSEALRPYAADTRRWVVLPLHSSLAVEQQDKVFDAGELHC
jgi:HrpA-like RNA helicase